MKKYIGICCSIVTVLFVLSGVTWAQDVKIGFFNFMKFGSKSAKAQELQKKLAGIVDQKRQQLDTKKKELVALKEQIEKTGPMLKDESRNAKIKEFSMKETELKLLEQEAQTALQNEQRETMEVLEKDISKIISQIRQEKNLSLVLRSDALLSADDKLDITDEVISHYDASPSKPAPKSPAGAKPAAPRR